MERSLILLLLTSPLCLFGNGGKPTVVKGQADYHAFGATEVVHVSDKTILEYRNFNIEAHETTRFEQPSSKSTLLCRVYGRNESVIHGKLQATGKLLLVNPNGICFSGTAHVNVGSLIASVLDISNENFLNDKFKFELAPGSSKRNITNKGRIEADHDVVFMAPNVVNQGIITAKTGKIALVVGEVITLDFDGDSMIQFAVEVPFKDGCIEQGGVLVSPEIYMHLLTAQRVIREVVNTTGVVEANCIVCEEGVIRLKEGSYTSAKKLFLKSGDAIEISGEIQASELCDLAADQEILWMRDNPVEKLVTTTPRLVLEGSISAKEWTHHALDLPATATPYSQDVLEKLQLPRDCIPLSIDAPLYVHGNLNVSAPHHEVRFLHGIEGVGGLEIKACGVDFKNNASLMGSLKLDVEGPVHFGGTEYVAGQHDLKGSLFKFSAEGQVTVSTESNVPILFQQGRIHLGENTSLTVASSAGPIELTEVEGRAGSNLTVNTPNNYLKIGAISGIDILELTSNRTTLTSTVDAGSIAFMGEGPVHLSQNVTAHAGDFASEGPLVFEASEIKLKALGGGSIRFDGSLSGNTELKLHAPEGEIELKGSVGSDTVRFKQVNLTGKKITQHEKVVSTGPVHYTANDIYLGHDIEANASITLDGPVTLFKNEKIILKAEVLKRRQVHLTSTLDAVSSNISLTIQNTAKESGTQIEGPIGRKGPLGNLIINSDNVSLGAIGGQGPGVVGLLKMDFVKAEFKGDTYYTGQQELDAKGRMNFTHLGAVDLKTKGNALKVGDKIYLVKPTAFNIDTQGGALDLGEVYSSVSLPISITTGKGDIFLHGIGESGASTYVSNLHVQGHTITLGGRVEAGNIVMTADENITQDNGDPSITGHESIRLKSLEKDIILSGHVHGKNVDMDAKDNIRVNKVFATGDVALNATDGNIILSNQVGTQKAPAKEIVMTAGKNILFNPPKDVTEKVKTDLEPGQIEIDPKRTLFAEGIIKLNAKEGAVGQAGEKQAISILTSSTLYVGSKEVSYLEGQCHYQLPYAISTNKPPLVYFNGVALELFNPRTEEILDTPSEEGLLKSLHPALSHKTSTGFMDGVVIQPRGAPIYYDISGK